MKKLIGIALVLAVITTLVFSSVALADDPVELYAEGDSTAEWSDEEAMIGEGSAKLTMPGRNWYIDPISNAEAQIDIEDIVVGDITDFNFYQKVDNVDLPVCIEFNLNEGRVIRGTGLNRTEFSGGDAPSTDWFQVDEGDISFYGRSWGYYQAKYSAYTAETVNIGYNPIGSMQSVIAYIDDFIINGITYSFELPLPEPEPEPEPTPPEPTPVIVYYIKINLPDASEQFQYCGKATADEIDFNDGTWRIQIPAGTWILSTAPGGGMAYSLVVDSNGNIVSDVRFVYHRDGEVTVTRWEP